MVDDLTVRINGDNGCYRADAALSIDAPIEAVWQTATASERIGWWFAPGNVGVEGGRIELNYRDGAFGMAGDVKVLFRPQIFEFTWDANELSAETIIRFDFIATRSATLATVTTLVFDSIEITYQVIATWQFMLEQLAEATVTEASIPDDEGRVAAIARDVARIHTGASN